jgi:S-adenosylmethionine:tRNA ribosyltransferase-isomerase
MPNSPRPVIRECNFSLKDYDYNLPQELIAQFPLKDRSSSRMLVVNRKDGSLTDAHFSDCLQYFASGDIMVFNDTRVFPAQLRGRKRTGGAVRLLLLEPKIDEPSCWKVLAKPRIKPGQIVQLEDSDIEVICKGEDGQGHMLMEFKTDQLKTYIKEKGNTPLPPYIKRLPQPSDKLTYQTVYASQDGAIAAPTAGLHFTDALLRSIDSKGLKRLNVTLHVGYGTFKPIRDLENHQMEAERFELTEEVASQINHALKDKRKIWSVGTTTTRCLETCIARREVMPGTGHTDLFIYPPFNFEVTGGLLTNFHLPRSTLLMLVSAFMGYDLMKKAYDHAVREKYRFYSYGDAMLIV